MKNLVYVLIFLFASPAFAGGSYLDGANSPQDAPVVIQDTPVTEKVTEKASEFKINEALYAESIGSNGYYGGGFYGEEKNYAQIPYYIITSRHRDFGFGTGFVVVNDQLIPTHLVSPFRIPFIRGGIIFNRGISLHLGGFGFGHGSFGFGHR